MYRTQSAPDSRVLLENGSETYPLATLRDEYGGEAHIILDDHCHVLVIKNAEGSFSRTSWWFREALEASRNLPLPSMG